MPSLPVVGQDVGTWGDLLLEFLAVALNSDGTLAPIIVDPNGTGAIGLKLTFSPNATLDAQAITIEDDNGAPIQSIANTGGWKTFGDRSQAGTGVDGPFIALDGTTQPPSILSPPALADLVPPSFGYGTGGRLWLANGTPDTQWVSGTTQVNDLWYNFAAGQWLTCTVSGVGTAAGTWEAGPFVGVTTTTTAPSAGAGSALPATPAGYMTVSINGSSHEIPYY